ncbi:MAG: hypothetical protein HC819_17040 [Cyclobacteriaceae bacterium]|nr:hypothetical protein [Cyclobacteriaceae bacterium]
MLKANWKYIVFLTGVLAMYFALLYFMPQRFNWFVTFYQKDKNPFGAYVFKTLTDHSWAGPVFTSNQTLYEMTLEDTLHGNNILVLCENYSSTPEELDATFKLANQGKTILVAAHQMDTTFTDSLGARINRPSFQLYLAQLWGEDSVGLRFESQQATDHPLLWLPDQLLPQYFEWHDPERAQVLATNTRGEVVLLRFPVGQGAIILSSTPMVFTNFSMIKSHNHRFVSELLSFMPQGTLHWTAYYQLGRMEATTPLRYILSEPSLKWALFILIVAVLIFMVSEARRKQRVIPVIEPPKNETLDFVKTIARLYYYKKDHKDLAAKKILHITEYLRNALQIDINEEMNEVVARVAAKTQRTPQEVKILFEQINTISQSRQISAGELRSLIDRTDQIFNNH